MKTAELEVGVEYAVGSSADMRRGYHYRVKRAVVQATGTHYSWRNPETGLRQIFSNKGDAERAVIAAGAGTSYSWQSRLDRGVLVRYDIGGENEEWGQQTLVPAQQIQMPWRDFLPIRDAGIRKQHAADTLRREIAATLERVGIAQIGPVHLGPEHADGGFPLASVGVNWEDLKHIIDQAEGR